MRRRRLSCGGGRWGCRCAAPRRREAEAGPGCPKRPSARGARARSALARQRRGKAAVGVAARRWGLEIRRGGRRVEKAHASCAVAALRVGQPTPVSASPRGDATRSEAASREPPGRQCLQFSPLSSRTKRRGRGHAARRSRRGLAEPLGRQPRRQASCEADRLLRSWCFDVSPHFRGPIDLSFSTINRAPRLLEGQRPCVCLPCSAPTETGLGHQPRRSQHSCFTCATPCARNLALLGLPAACLAIVFFGRGLWGTQCLSRGGRLV